MYQVKNGKTICFKYDAICNKRCSVEENNFINTHFWMDHIAEIDRKLSVFQGFHTKVLS